MGLIYRKQPEVSFEEKEETVVVKSVKRIHCGASIPKDSKYCKECSRKQ